MILLFTVIGLDGHPKMGTDYRECVYDIDQIESMASAGCKFKWNDKLISLSNLKKELGAKNETAESATSNESFILCLETGDKFKKQSEAAKALGIDPAAVSDSLKTGRKRAGYTFTRIEV